MSIQRALFALGLIAMLAQSAYAHTYLSSVVIGGKALTEGDCVRPHPATTYDNPISLVSSPDMTCGFLPQAAEAANRKCPIAAGATISIQWHHNNNLSTDDILDPSHKGPILVYLANSDTGSGNVWFKIFEDGWTASTNTWATDRMIAAKGLTTVTIPSDIAPGNYLLRAEVLALHNAYNLDGVQPYVGCVELTISGSGSSKPAGVAFPGAYLDTDPGILINIYNGLTSYTIPGPALYGSGATSSSGVSVSTSGSSSSSSSGSATSSAPATQAPSTPAPATSATSNSATSGTSASSTSAPSGGSGGNLVVQMSGGSSTWWLGVIVSGGSEATSKVEITDSGSVSSWTALTSMSYAYVFSQSVQLTLPISVRLTSASGNQVVLSNVFTSWTMTSAINTGKNYGSSSATSATSSTPATQAPTTAPTKKPSNPSTSAPTTAPTAKPVSTGSPSSSSSSVKVTVYPSASAWWFACTVSGLAVDSVASVELKDAGSVTSYALMTNNGWAYSLNANGSPFVLPLSVRVTDESGNSYTAAISSFTANTVVSAV